MNFILFFTGTILFFLTMIQARCVEMLLPFVLGCPVHPSDPPEDDMQCLAELDLVSSLLLDSSDVLYGFIGRVLFALSYFLIGVFFSAPALSFAQQGLVQSFWSPVECLASDNYLPFHAIQTWLSILCSYAQSRVSVSDSPFELRSAHTSSLTDLSCPPYPRLLHP